MRYADLWSEGKVGNRLLRIGLLMFKCFMVDDARHATRYL